MRIGAVMTSVVPIEVVDRSRGLPSLQVHAITQDSFGGLWFGGPAGISRLDGERVRSFDQRDGLKTHGTRALSPAENGGVWVGSDCGIDLIDEHGAVSTPSTPDFDDPNFLVECFWSNESGGVWAGTNSGVFALKEKRRWEKVGPNLNELVRAVTADSKNNLWAATTSGLHKWNGQQWVPVSEPVRSIGSIRTLNVDPLGGLLVGGDGGLVQIDETGAVIFSATAFDGIPVSAALLDDNQVWVGGANRLYCIRTDQLKRGAANTVAHASVNALHADPQNNVWVATDSNGVLKVSSLRHAIKKVVLKNSGAVFSISARSEDLTMIIGLAAGAEFCNSNVVDEIDSLGPTTLPSLQKERVWDSVMLDNGTILAACESGLTVTSPPVDEAANVPNVTRIGAAHAVLGAPGRALLTEPLDSFLIGTMRGLCRVSNGEIVEISRADGTSIGYVYTLVRDAHLRIWIGTLGSGLWCFDQNTATPVLGPGLRETGNTTAISFDSKGNAVVLQDNRIVYCNMREDGALHVSSIEETLDSISGWSCAHDSTDSLWVGSPSGLKKYAADNRKLTRHVSCWFGIDGWEFTTSRSLRIDPTGRIWCGVSSGLLVVDPELLPSERDTPTADIADLVWSLPDDDLVPQTHHESTRSHRAFFLPDGKWTIEVSFRTCWYVDESSVTFRYRLLGFDRDWTHPRYHTARYSSLPPGTYTLEVQAHAALVGWGSTTELLTLHVTRGRGARKRPPSGWASLTPTELSVVELVVEGLTNPQIAEQMFIARGTVKAHLSSVFAKVGVTSRAELAAMGARRATPE
jgi:ligand-binding sensor domain-containing protein/DNA-binding CsgD family transcriptional regulator